MSYCRTGPDSDVYVIGTCPRDRVVWQCMSGPDHFYEAATRREMLEHLKTHRTNGDKVPRRALNRLLREMENENGDTIR